MVMKIVILLHFVFYCLCAPTTSNRSFVIDGNTFLKDGEPFRYISGSLHYFRIPYQYWEDRLYKARKAGLNAIEMYVAWNVHEKFKGIYSFTQQNDLFHFIQLAQQQDLLVILRPGPYICAEWEYGGFPYWLLNEIDPKTIRTSDPTYLQLVDNWFSQFLTRIKPLLYQNGGPIITVQVENEYGSYGCDHDYMSSMGKLLRKYLGDEIILFTTDGASTSLLKCGSLSPTLYASVDFGPGGDVDAEFAVQRTVQQQGPLVNSEYYTGWLDHWGEKHHTTSSQAVCNGLDKMLSLNASVNLYMFHGGTNFDFMNGANAGNPLQPVTTSYDYDAPITEAGDPTEKYWSIQKVISKYQTIPEGPQPKPTEKMAYGKVTVEKGVSFFAISELIAPIINEFPQTFEKVNLAYGYLWYQANIMEIIANNGDNNLNLGTFHDRASVYVDKVLQGILTSGKANELKIVNGTWLDIIVENEGRIGYSGAMKRPEKGILGNVTLNGKNVTNWKMYPYGFSTDVPFPLLSKKIEKLLHEERSNELPQPPAFYGLTIYIDEAKDTFLKLNNFEKGFVAVNGMFQKYWTSAGPQRTLFIPKTYLLEGEENSFVILETDLAPSPPQVEFVDSPIFV